MILRSPTGLKNGYLISLILHGILLLIMAFLAIRPLIPVKWHNFEWEQNSEERPALPASTKGLTSNTAQAKQAEPVKASEPQPSIAQPVSKGDLTPAIEQPKVTETSSAEQNRTAVRVVRTPGRNALKNIGQNLPGGDFGFSASLEQGGGDAYIISQPKPAVVPTEEGEVYLEFKLTSLGTIDMGSVNILSYSTASYADAVQKVLRSWKFGFRGQYNPEKTYRIRCKFVIDE